MVSVGRGARFRLREDADGVERRVRGLYAALSYDEGETWPVRRLITDDGPGLTAARLLQRHIIDAVLTVLMALENEQV